MVGIRLFLIYPHFFNYTDFCHLEIRYGVALWEGSLIVYQVAAGSTPVAIAQLTD